MSPLCASDHGFVESLSLIWDRNDLHRHHHGFGAYHLHPPPPNAAARPIVPKDWERSEERRGQGQRFWWSEHGSRRNGTRGFSERPVDGADSSWFPGGKTFLALCPQLAVTAITDAGSIQHTQGAVSFRSTFLWIQRVIGGAEQATIGLRSKSRSGEASCKRLTSPHRLAIF